YFRTVQLACFHVARPPKSVNEVIATCARNSAFDENKDKGDVAVLVKQLKRELAILLTHFRRTKLILWEVHALLLEWMQKSKDRQEQIHYFYCLRLLHDGWTKEEKEALVTWYESTRTWNGGASYRGFLNNVFRDALTAFDDDDRKSILEKAE